MGKFYHTVSQSSTGSTATGASTADPIIELNGDVLGYGPASEVLTSIAPTGVVPGIYSAVEVNEKGQVVKGYTAEVNMGLAIRKFNFVYPAQRWRVVHNLGTTDFTEFIKNSEGRKLFANIRIVDSNEFWVELTEPEVGSVVVTFDLSSAA